MTAIPRRLFGIALLLVFGSAAAAADSVVVQMRTVDVTLAAYAQVTPVVPSRLRAQATGQLAAVAVQPGDRVAAGQVLARLAGAEISARIAARRAAVRAAQATVTVARQALAVQREKFTGKLATRLAVDKAQAALAQALAIRDRGRAELAAALAAAQITAPSAGTVLSLEAAAGDRVTAGQLLLTLQSSGNLRLRAVFYGTAAATVRADMAGQFQTADGTAPVAVQVRAVVGRLQRDGGEVVWLKATAPHPGWRNGEAGRVQLRAGSRSVALVPTRALILDRGQWWVLVRRDGQDVRQQVVPGAAAGGDTAILHGLAAGEQVVVTNAYLRFHRDVAARFQPPD